MTEGTDAGKEHRAGASSGDSDRDRNGRFVKGKSGNPGGRKPGIKHHGLPVTRWKDLFKDDSRIDEYIQSIVMRADNGDMKAQTYLIDRVWPASGSFAAYMHERVRREDEKEKARRDSIEVEAFDAGPAEPARVVVYANPALPGGRVVAVDEKDQRASKARKHVEIRLPWNGRESGEISRGNRLAVTDLNQWVDLLNKGLHREPVEITLAGERLAGVVVAADFYAREIEIHLQDDSVVFASYSENPV